MRNITLNQREETVLKNLLEVQIETLMDLWGTQEELEKEFEWFNFKTMVSLYQELGGTFDTPLMREGLKLFKREG